VWADKLPQKETCGNLLQGEEDFYGQNSCYQTDLSGNAWFIPPEYGTPTKGEPTSGYSTPGIFQNPSIVEMKGMGRFLVFGPGKQTATKRGNYVFYNYGSRPFHEDSYIAVTVTQQGSTAQVHLDVKTSWAFEDYKLDELRKYTLQGDLTVSLNPGQRKLWGKLKYYSDWRTYPPPPYSGGPATGEFDFSTTVFVRKVVLSDYAGTLPLAAPSSIPILADAYLRNAVWHFEQPSVTLIPQLCYDAIASRNYFTGNMLALIGDFKNLYEDFDSQVGNINDFAEALKAKDFRKALLAGDSQYLATKYGYKLTLGDTEDLLKALKQAIEDKAFSLGQNWTVRAEDKLSYTNNQGMYFECAYSWTGQLTEPDNLLLSGIYRAMQWDYWPSLGNMWDFIPYSFCVDWLVAIGPLLENLDLSITTLYLRLAYALATTKVDYEGSFSTLLSPEWAGHATLKSYRRQIRTAFEPFPFISWKGSGLEGHFLESAGLITQRFLSGTR
jgi:hypothetical protein